MAWRNLGDGRSQSFVNIRLDSIPPGWVIDPRMDGSPCGAVVGQ